MHDMVPFLISYHIYDCTTIKQKTHCFTLASHPQIVLMLIVLMLGYKNYYNQLVYGSLLFK